MLVKALLILSLVVLSSAASDVANVNDEKNFINLIKELFEGIKDAIEQAFHQHINHQEYFYGLNAELGIVSTRLYDTCVQEESFLIEQMIAAIWAFRNNQTAIGLTDLILALEVVEPATSDCALVVEEALEYILPIVNQFRDDFKPTMKKIWDNLRHNTNPLAINFLSLFRNLITNRDFQAGTNDGAITAILFNGIIPALPNTTDHTSHSANNNKMQELIHKSFRIAAA